MRRIAANLVYTVAAPPARDAVVTLDDAGRVVDVAAGGRLREAQGIEFYNGALVPCLVDACWRPGPAAALSSARPVADAARRALRRMWGTGVAAVADADAAVLSSAGSPVSVADSASAGLPLVVGAPSYEGGFALFCPRPDAGPADIAAGLPSPDSLACLGSAGFAAAGGSPLFAALLSLVRRGLPFADALRWATLNPARALGIGGLLGSIEPGKRPGLALVSPFDFAARRPAAGAVVTRLV